MEGMNQEWFIERRKKWIFGSVGTEKRLEN
jgi:hypothetical protein